MLRAPVIGDIPRLAELLNAHAVSVDGQANTTEAEVRGWFSLPGLVPEHDMRLVVAPDGCLLGYADIAGQGSGPVHVDLRVPPEHREVAPLLLDAMEARASELGAPPRPLRVHISSAEAATSTLLRGRGYLVVRSSFRMERAIAGSPLPTPSWPAGITVRTSAGPEEFVPIYEVSEEAFADHWEHHPATFEQWCGWNVRDSLDHSLWFVAEDGNQLVGIALCRLDETPDPALGWVSVLAVRRPWRGRGVARALLLHSFDALRDRGCSRVGLGVDAENTTGAVRLYESVGMRVVRRGNTWERSREKVVRT